MSAICVVIPAHNEASSVTGVVEEVMSIVGEIADVVVVDDHSTDETADVARRAGATVISLCSQLGAWGATQAGIRYARKFDHRMVITIDADGQHSAQDIPALINAQEASGANMIIGADPSRASALRKSAWRLIRASSGLTTTDLTSGFRLYDGQCIDILAARPATLVQYQDVGVLALLHQHGMRVSEETVRMSQRVDGSSRIFSSWLKVSQYMLTTLILGTLKRPMFARKENREKSP